MKKQLIFGSREDIALCGSVSHNRRGHLVIGACTGMLEPDGRKQIVYFATGTADLAQALAEAEKFLQGLREQWDRAKARPSPANPNSPADAKSEPDPPLSEEPEKKDPHFSYKPWPGLTPWLEQVKRRSRTAWIFPKFQFPTQSPSIWSPPTLCSTNAKEPADRPPTAQAMSSAAEH